MRDFIDIGPTPAEEPCAQLGTPGYEKKARETNLDTRGGD